MVKTAPGDLSKKLPVYNRVKVLRLDSGFTRSGMAKDLGIAYVTLGAIERQQYRPSLDLAYRVAKFFDLPLDSVWHWEPMVPISEMLYSIRCSKD